MVKIKFWSLLAVISVLCSCNAQHRKATFPLNNYCSYTGARLPSEIAISVTEIKYDQLFREIYAVAAGNSNPDVFFWETFFDDVAFCNIYGSNRYIFYNRSRFDSLVAKTGTIQSVRSVIAHELSHLVNNHPLRYTPNAWIFEIEADYYSGKILRQFNATVDESVVAMRIYGNEEETSSHPSRSSRISAIKRGWINESMKIFQSHAVEFDSIVYEVSKQKASSELDVVNRLTDAYLSFVSSRERFTRLVDSLGLDETSLQRFVDEADAPELRVESRALFIAPEDTRYDSAVVRTPQAIRKEIRKSEKSQPERGEVIAEASASLGRMYGVDIWFKDGQVFNDRMERMGTIQDTGDTTHSKIVLDGREYFVNDSGEIIASFPDGSRSVVGYKLN